MSPIAISPFFYLLLVYYEVVFELIGFSETRILHIRVYTCMSATGRKN